MNADRFVITDHLWDRISGLLPGRDGTRGVSGLCCTKTFVGGSGMDSLNKINVLAARPEESFKQLAH